MKTIITIVLAIVCLLPATQKMAQTKIDAAIDFGEGHGKGKIYFFTGEDYYRYDKKSQNIDAGYPKKISAHWPGVWTSDIDAACSFLNSVYFFKDDECVKYDKATRKVAPGYPKKISDEWRGIEGPVDAVFQKGESVYFIKGSACQIYAQSTEKAGAAKDLKEVVPGSSFNRIDASFKRPGKGIYFFSNESYIRMNENSFSLDAGYPKLVSVWGIKLDSKSSGTHRLSGLITDAKGKAAPGIEITIGGSTQGNFTIVTDEDGRYQYDSPLPVTILRVTTGCGAKPLPSAAVKSKKAGLAYTVNLQDGNMHGLNFQLNCSLESMISDTEFRFLKHKPKVVFLIHGITGSAKPGSHVNTKVFPYDYWGFDMVNRLSGNKSFVKYRADNPGNIPATQKLKLFSKGKPTNKAVDKITWRKIGDSKRPDATIDQIISEPHALYTSGLKDGVPEVSIVPLYRNGGARLKEQIQVTVEDIYNYYQDLFGDFPKEQQPQIILVSHSFGGIVSRFILTNPDEEFSGQEMMTADQRKLADYIRDRTLHLITLATPHNNSPLPAQAQEIDKNFSKLAAELRLTSDLPIQYNSQEIISALDRAADLVEDNFIRDKVGGNRPCMIDFKNMVPDIVNQGTLAPEKMKRTDGSLIPLFALGGRSPGHTFFDIERNLLNPTEISVTDIWDEASGEGQNAFLLLVTDNLLGATSGSMRPWGESKFKRADEVALSSKVLDLGAFDILEFVLKDFHCKRNQINDSGKLGDREYDTDGFVGFDSALGLYLGTDDPEYFSNEKNWTIARKSYIGSWYRILPGKYGDYLAWDWDNHSTIRNNGPMGLWLYDNVVNGAGPLPGKGLWSVWNSANVDKEGPNLKQNKIRVAIHDIEALEDLDLTGEADFYATVQFGHDYQQPTKHIEDKDHIIPNWIFTWSGKGESIPIRISIGEKDDDEDFLGSQNDRININPTIGKEDLFLVYDIRNGVIFDEDGVIGMAGERITLRGDTNDPDRAKIIISVDLDQKVN